MKTLNQFLDESVGGGVPITPQELEIQKKMSRLNVRLARKRSQEMQKAKIKDTEVAPEQVKEDARLAMYQSGMTDASRVKGPVGKAVDKVKSTFKKKKRLDPLDRYRFQSGMTKEEVIDERTLSSYIPSDRQGEARRANLDYTKAQLKKKEDQSTKNRGDLSKRDAGKMAKERLRTKKIMSMGEGEDKAFNYVVAKLRKQHGKDAVITKDNPIKPPTAAQKAKVAAHKAKLAKQDHRDPTEKASDGRYSDRYSNRGSD